MTCRLKVSSLITLLETVLQVEIHVLFTASLLDFTRLVLFLFTVEYR